MKRCLLLLSCLLNALAYSQEKPFLAFDLINGTTDTIAAVDYDPTILSESTAYHKGCFDARIEFLNTSLPETNVFPESQFTQKRRAADDFDLTMYPIRTSVKLFRTKNDTLFNLCSGSIISKRHVITAAHCVSNPQTKELFLDSLYAAPVFDEGEFSDTFSGSYTSKIYFFEDWTYFGEDIAILELEDPIGLQTGWISIGYDNSDSELQKGIFYKFSYPAAAFPPADPNRYNGDTLYYNYGAVDNVDENRLSITNAVGAGGESGSSIIKVVNDEAYATYGVLSLAANISHSRINNRRYYAIKSIIADDLTLPGIGTTTDIIVYPNPTDGLVRLKNTTPSEIVWLGLYDATGRRCLFQDSIPPNLELNLSPLAEGTYILRIKTADATITKRVVKTAD